MGSRDPQDPRSKEKILTLAMSHLALVKLKGPTSTNGHVTWVLVGTKTSLKWLTVAMPLLEIIERLERDWREAYHRLISYGI